MSSKRVSGEKKSVGEQAPDNRIFIPIVNDFIYNTQSLRDSSPILLTFKDFRNLPLEQQEEAQRMLPIIIKPVALDLKCRTPSTDEREYVGDAEPLFFAVFMEDIIIGAFEFAAIKITENSRTSITIIMTPSPAFTEKGVAIWGGTYALTWSNFIIGLFSRLLYNPLSLSDARQLITSRLDVPAIADETYLSRENVKNERGGKTEDDSLLAEYPELKVTRGTIVFGRERLFIEKQVG